MLELPPAIYEQYCCSPKIFQVRAHLFFDYAISMPMVQSLFPVKSGPHARWAVLVLRSIISCPQEHGSMYGVRCTVWYMGRQVDRNRRFLGAFLEPLRRSRASLCAHAYIHTYLYDTTRRAAFDRRSVSYYIMQKASHVLFWFDLIRHLPPIVVLIPPALFCLRVVCTAYRR